MWESIAYKISVAERTNGASKEPCETHEKFQDKKY